MPKRYKLTGYIDEDGDLLANYDESVFPHFPKRFVDGDDLDRFHIPYEEYLRITVEIWFDNGVPCFCEGGDYQQVLQIKDMKVIDNPIEKV